MATAEGQRTLRAAIWNLFLGGVDGASEECLKKQAEILLGLHADIVCLPEGNRGDEDGESRLWWMADTLGLQPVAMARSRLGTPPVQNHTVLLYRPSTLRLMGSAVLGRDMFHQALIGARLRPVEEHDDRCDFLVLATHLAYTDGETRLRQAHWMTDYGGEFPGVPLRGVLPADLNVSDREPSDWSLIPRNLHSRYRIVKDDGSFGGVDQRALQVLLHSGRQDPQTLMGVRMTPDRRLLLPQRTGPVVPGPRPRQRHARDVVPHTRHTTGMRGGSPAGHCRPGGPAMSKVHRSLPFDDSPEVLPEGQIPAPHRGGTPWGSAA